MIKQITKQFSSRFVILNFILPDGGLVHWYQILLLRIDINEWTTSYKIAIVATITRTIIAKATATVIIIGFASVSILFFAFAIIISLSVASNSIIGTAHDR